ncbi:MAG: hypothetical protein H6815_09160 [Phycisphaeraceae bacterium]|nr:hypothetical protein [Phycisphaerales bacterium]MCB9860606.1 hypothetical protein [Phycisphaeraceae bacterium]
MLNQTIVSTVGSLTVGPVAFDRPKYLLLIPILVVLAVFIGRRNLSGLATVTRKAALVVRCIVLAMLVCVLARPSLQEKAERVAVTAILDVSRSISPQLQDDGVAWIENNIKLNKGRNNGRSDDQFAALTVAVNPFVQSLLSSGNTIFERSTVGQTDGTDLASSIRLALSLKPADAGYRLLLVSDGNETAGNLVQAAQEARAAGVPIDVLPLQYSSQNEVVVEDLVVQSVARVGDVVNLRIRISTARLVAGILSVTVNDQPYDLDPNSNAMGVRVEIDPQNPTVIVPVKLAAPGPQKFDAFFDPEKDGSGRVVDVIPDNNRSSGVTFVASEGRLLVLMSDINEVTALERVIAGTQFQADFVLPSEGPNSLLEYGAYDGIIMLNTPQYLYTQQQVDDIIHYVRDLGGGLLVIGGPDALGAGGWIGTPLEEILPLRLDPPQKRQLPAGALVLVNHSIEMPDGRYYGKQTAMAAIDALTRLDYFGIVEYAPGIASDSAWVHPLSLLGDKVAAKRAINNLVFGDMPSFDPSLRMALSGLQNINAGAKHVIVISDGDPSLSNNIVQMYVKAQITVTAIAVNPHGGPSDPEVNKMKDLATSTGGNYFLITRQADYATLPKIIFREAETVRRPLIWEGDPFVPTITGALHETLAGLTGVPPLTGYVVTADRDDGRAVVTMRGQENDPIAAHWPVGLGRVSVFASDGAARWTTPWTGWGGFASFWENHIRWMMKPAGSANLRTFLTNEGDQTHAVIEIATREGERINLATIEARVTDGLGESRIVEFQQIAPGKYEAFFESGDPGTYVMGARFEAPNPDGSGNIVKGVVQASVNRPFADEFRALQDNTPLLQRIADLTSGRVLDVSMTDAEIQQSSLWDREGIVFPLSKDPIWLQLALAAIAMFLLDVAIRRVRIDIPRMFAAVTAGFRKTTQTAGASMQSLQAAREKARAQMGGKSGSDDARPLTGAGAAPISNDATKSAKFEVDPEQLKRKPVATDDPIAGMTKEQKQSMKRAQQQQSQSADEEQGMSRLLKAKRRAQDEFDEE